MGEISNSINHYLSDNRRFADLFNGICFQGETVVRAEELSETLQVYYGITDVSSESRTAYQIGEGERYPERRDRTRDICKQLKSGGTLRILAVENQEKVGYTMPYRCMEYDVMEYGKQLDLPAIWKERKNYMEKNEENEEEYDMCQAIREWAEEERSIGRQEGLDEKTGVIVRNMLKRGMTDADIMAIAECNQELIDGVRSEIKAAVIRL